MKKQAVRHTFGWDKLRSAEGSKITLSFSSPEPAWLDMFARVCVFKE